MNGARIALWALASVLIVFLIAPIVIIMITSFNGTVTLALASNPGGSTLGGTLTVTASGGVATFSGLTLDKSGPRPEIGPASWVGVSARGGAVGSP